MNKRSAMVAAAGLVAALLAGGAALSFSLTGGTAAAQDAARVKPIVRTEHRTVTIHKRAKAAPAEVVTLSASTGSTAPTTGVSTDEGSAYEDEHESEQEDDAFEQAPSDDHSDGHESGGDD